MAGVRIIDGALSEGRKDNRAVSWQFLNFFSLATICFTKIQEKKYLRGWSKCNKICKTESLLCYPRKSKQIKLRIPLMWNSTLSRRKPIKPFQQTHFGAEGQVTPVMHRHLGQPLDVIATYFRQHLLRSARYDYALFELAQATLWTDKCTTDCHNHRRQSRSVVSDVWADNYESALIRQDRYRTKATPAISTHRDDTSTLLPAEWSRYSACHTTDWYFIRYFSGFERASERVSERERGRVRGRGRSLRSMVLEKINMHVSSRRERDDRTNHLVDNRRVIKLDAVSRKLAISSARNWLLPLSVSYSEYRFLPSTSGRRNKCTYFVRTWEGLRTF